MSGKSESCWILFPPWPRVYSFIVVDDFQVRNLVADPVPAAQRVRDRGKHNSADESAHTSHVMKFNVPHSLLETPMVM